jgi:hypothetical protein
VNKNTKWILALLTLLSLELAVPLEARGSHSHHSYQGGHYQGGHGSSHKGGHYKNRRTGDHYTHHK